MLKDDSKPSSIQFQQNELREKMQTHDLSYNGVVPVRMGGRPNNNHG